METQPDFGGEAAASRKEYLKKFINEIGPGDEGVQLVGYARKVNASQEFYLDDATGQINVREIPEEVAAIQTDRLYRVLGECSLDGSGSQYLAAAFIQDMNDLNMELYQKALRKKKEIP